MSKYSDKIFEKVLDDMPNQVTEVSTMEGSYLGAHCVPIIYWLIFKLIAITKELTETLRRNKTIDWQKRESMRVVGG